MKLIDSSFPVGGGTVLVKATDSGFLSKTNKASTEDSDLWGGERRENAVLQSVKKTGGYLQFLGKALLGKELKL